MPPASDSDVQDSRRLHAAIAGIAETIEARIEEAPRLSRIGGIVRDLVRYDDWLPDACGRADETTYRQYLLHRDPAERFVVASFVWSAGQATPIHDHGGLWGAVGVLRGVETSQAFKLRDERPVPSGRPRQLAAGEVELLPSDDRGIHRVANEGDTAAISIHVYGGQIDRVTRRQFDPKGGPRTFLSPFFDPDAPIAGR